MNLPDTVICTSYMTLETVEVSRGSLEDRLSVYAIIVTTYEGERSLLMVRGTTHKRLFLPGGGVDLGEREEEALLREIQEEAGVTILTSRRTTPVHVNPMFYDPDQKAWNCILVIYVCTLLSNTTDLSDGHPGECTPEWVPISTLRSRTDLQDPNMLRHILHLQAVI